MTTTHAAWRGDMNNVIDLDRLLEGRVETRIAALQAHGAGPEHLNLVHGLAAALGQLVKIGDRIIVAADDDAIPVGEAFAAAGGDQWIADATEFLSHD